MQKPQVEYHTKLYGKIKGTEKLIGLSTRVIITKNGKSTIKDFEYQKHAQDYITELFGSLQDAKYEIVSNYKKYGEKGYTW
jgi:hypothetical protein